MTGFLAGIAAGVALGSDGAWLGPIAEFVLCVLTGTPVVSLVACGFGEAAGLLPVAAVFVPVVLAADFAGTIGLPIVVCPVPVGG